jgi:hypothetical protein
MSLLCVCGKDFRAVAGSANCFFQQSLQKQLFSRLQVEKKCFKVEKPIPVVFFTKSNSSEQNIYRNRRLKIHFQRCCASQNKTRKIKTNSNSILRYVLKYFSCFII